MGWSESNPLLCQYKKLSSNLRDTIKSKIDKREKNKKGILTGCLVLLSLFLILYLGLILLGAVLIVSDPIEPVDAVVVLSGDDGDRLALAIEMHERGLAPSLVITDTTRQANRLLIREAEDGGFPEDEIYVTDIQVGSTVDEAQAVRAFALDQGWDALMIVTDPYHSFRARFIFRRELRGSGVEVFFRPVVGHWFRSSSWFFYPDGWKFAFLEVGKFISYLFLGR
jgi:uncharacterized SAM-binding protein YcdF (DUF218 family)